MGRKSTKGKYYKYKDLLKSKGRKQSRSGWTECVVADTG